MARSTKMRKKSPSNTCIECGGTLEACDNVDSHTNLRTCISVLRERIDSLLDQINHPEG